MNQININRMKMIFLFLVYVVPALTFTLTDNVINDDYQVNKKNVKSLYSVTPKTKGLRSSGDPSDASSRYSKGNLSRQKKQQTRKNNRSSRNNKETEEEKALQRAITFTNPMVPLQFRDTVKKKPKRKNLKPERLLRKMGKDFNPNWMSIETPLTRTGDNDMVEMSQTQISRLFEEVNSLNLEEDLRQLIQNRSSEEINDELSAERDNKDPSSVDVSKMASIFTQWLVRKSVCPVTFTWIDLGIYFWPRWIKSGACESDSKAILYESMTRRKQDPEIVGQGGCSWPKGMKCVQDDVETLQILRWHCRKRRKNVSGRDLFQNNETKGRKKHIHKCKWYKVPYPITSSCKCSSN